MEGDYMQILTEILELETSKRVQIIDITRNIDAALAESGLRKGLVNIYSKHSTSAIFINENESGLLEDYQNLIESLIPTGNNYKHNRIDNNADSHLRSFIIGNNEQIYRSSLTSIMPGDTLAQSILHSLNVTLFTDEEAAIVETVKHHSLDHTSFGTRYGKSYRFNSSRG